MIVPATMHGQALAFGRQLRESAALATGLVAGPFDGVALCGLGGSAAGGALARGFLHDRLRLPVTPGLPGHVGPGSLVVVTSYSGATAEALDAFAEAGRRGARRVVITSGGALAQRAADTGVPVVLIPGGWQPRGALGYLLGPLLVLLDETGAAPGAAGLIGPGADAADLAAGRDDEARDVAAALAGTVPVLYGAGLRAPVAVRLKAQINENAKVAAFAGELPEVAHNEVLGWLQLRRTAHRHTAVFLRDANEPPALAALIAAVAAEVAGDGAQVLSLTAAGADEVCRAFGLLAFGDLVSCHLAVNEGTDPLDTARLDRLKARLALARE